MTFLEFMEFFFVLICTLSGSCAGLFIFWKTKYETLAIISGIFIGALSGIFILGDMVL